MRYLPEDNLSYPVLILLDGGGSGSGFYLDTDEDLYLITAKHVLFKNSLDGATKMILRTKVVKLISYLRDQKIKTAVNLVLNLELLDIIEHPTTDVAVIKIGNLIQKEGDGIKIKWLDGVTINGPAGSPIVGVPLSHCKKYEDVLVSNEVFVFGYPNSLGNIKDKQIDYARPLLRKGIVAGKNDINKTIIIDCPVHFGNSGGLAMEAEDIDYKRRKYYAIGIVAEFVPFIEELKSKQYGTVNTNIENSGYGIVMPMDNIFDILDTKITPR